MDSEITELIENREINYLTEGSIIKAIIFLSIPIFFANLLQTAY